MLRSFAGIRSISFCTAGLLALLGGEATAAVGGPDAFGYTFVDQDDGAVFNYVDIRATGTLLASGDDATGTTPLGAPITIYGIVYNELGVSTNGFVSDTNSLTADFTNDCPLPDPPSSGAGSFRAAAMHDDLVGDVYYQYFNQGQAAMVGYPGQQGGISVFQWYGQHFAGMPDTVDIELILFHEDDSMLAMVNLESENGAGGTMGIQNSDASIGLTYDCNTAGFITPGVTAVLYTPGPTPDSDCCNASPSGTGGCINDACESIVCSTDPSCCTNDWDAMCAAAAQVDCALLCGAPLPIVSINEIRVDQQGGGPDPEEYFELVGNPGVVLDDLHYIVLGDNPTGVIEEAIPLAGALPPTFFFVVAEPTFTLGVADIVTPLNFENNDTVTHMLVSGFTGSVGDSLDPNGDGVLDTIPWLALVDAVSIIEEAGEDEPYAGPPNCNPSGFCQQIADPPNTPGHIFRCGNYSGGWNVGRDDVSVLPLIDTPGDGNACDVCGNGILNPGEICDELVETATCDSDCTPPACGDGVPNMAAGEECDDGGESVGCDPDCTLAICGDGQINMTAGEVCDDGGESATCDTDCTPPECGDGVTNMTVGEACDDAGESANCDPDCTPAECGDGFHNVTAGEACDEGGQTDTCNVNCTLRSCGDGFLNPGEECDGDGVGVPGPTDTCDADCTAAMCGDAVHNPLAGEECDEGGNSAACDEDCTAPECGDGLINEAAGEDCDEGQTPTCDIDCTAAECGDGTLNFAAGEQCDDSNTDDGDGCSAECTIESGPVDTGSGTDDTGGTGDPDDSGTSGSGAATSLTTASTTAGLDESTGGSGEDDGSTGSGSGGLTPLDDGCNCSAGENRRSGVPWGWLVMLGLGAMARRRRTPA